MLFQNIVHNIDLVMFIWPVKSEKARILKSFLGSMRLSAQVDGSYKLLCFSY